MLEEEFGCAARREYIQTAGQASVVAGAPGVTHDGEAIHSDATAVTHKPDLVFSTGWFLTGFMEGKARLSYANKAIHCFFCYVLPRYWHCSPWTLKSITFLVHWGFQRRPFINLIISTFFSPRYTVPHFCAWFSFLLTLDNNVQSIQNMYRPLVIDKLIVNKALINSSKWLICAKDRSAYQFIP